MMSLTSNLKKSGLCSPHSLSLMLWLCPQLTQLLYQGLAGLWELRDFLRSHTLTFKLGGGSRYTHRLGKIIQGCTSRTCMACRHFYCWKFIHVHMQMHAWFVKPLCPSFLIHRSAHALQYLGTRSLDVTARSVKAAGYGVLLSHVERIVAIASLIGRFVNTDVKLQPLSNKASPPSPPSTKVHFFQASFLDTWFLDSIYITWLKTLPQPIKCLLLPPKLWLKWWSFPGLQHLCRWLILTACSTGGKVAFF